jgi:hypothetical protein
MIVSLKAQRRFDLLTYPRNLAERMSGIQPTETVRLPIDAARRRAREILDQFLDRGHMPIVENWRQVADGQIEFTIRNLPLAD